MATGLALVAVAGAVLVTVDPFGDDAPTETACNGSEHLCGRTLDQVSFAATHNSMSAADQPGWKLTQQERGIPAQLDAGIRGFLIDMYYATRTSRGVQNVPVTKVDERLGRRPHGRDIYLCHTLCGLGATRATDALRAISEFLDAHPREAVFISIEDYVRPRDVASAFEESGLSRYVWRDRLAPLPTLGELVDSDHRVVAMTEHRTDPALPWLHAQFDLFQETPYRFSSPAEVAAPSSCRPNRGNPGNPLFLLNNWVDTSPFPRASNAAEVNARRALLRRARRCEELRHRLPNLVAVDFYEEGDVLGVVADLNR